MFLKLSRDDTMKFKKTYTTICHLTNEKKLLAELTLAKTSGTITGDRKKLANS